MSNPTISAEAVASTTERTSDPVFVLPPGAIALVTPWMTDGQGQYVGLPADPLFLQCTEFNELGRATPILCNLFLSMAEDVFFQEDDPPNDPPGQPPVLSTEIPARHQHDLPHKHYQMIAPAAGTDVVLLDRDDSGGTRDFAATKHSHALDLPQTNIQTGEEARQRWHEPRHYELAAFWVRDEGIMTTVPAGMIAFRRDAQEQLPGWRRLDMKPLTRDPRDPDPTYSPRTWDGETFKVVGCHPAKMPKGADTHDHDVPGRRHPEPRLSAGTDVTTLDRPGRLEDKQDAAQAHHTHAITTVTNPPGRMTEAPNLRRHRPVTVWVAEVDGIDMPQGMIIPYIPTNPASYAALPSFRAGKWAPLLEPTARDFDPVLLTAFNNNDYQPGQGPWDMQGSNTHTHEITHAHRVSFGAAQGHHEGDDENESPASSMGHGHPDLHVEHVAETTESLNPLRYRRVAFIITTS